MTYVGRYLVCNRSKYFGIGQNPIYKSSLELKIMHFMDTNEKVIKWGYELIRIPYYFPIDGKIHDYVVDFVAHILNNKGELIKYLIEIKSDDDLSVPKKPSNPTSKNIKHYKNKMMIYIRNTNKWSAAEKFCKSTGFVWKLLSTRDIF
jgi:hypothetical protein